jgi:hypothetical protein
MVHNGSLAVWIIQAFFELMALLIVFSIGDIIWNMIKRNKPGKKSTDSNPGSECN